MDLVDGVIVVCNGGSVGGLCAIFGVLCCTEFWLILHSPLLLSGIGMISLPC